MLLFAFAYSNVIRNLCIFGAVFINLYILPTLNALVKVTRKHCYTLLLSLLHTCDTIPQVCCRISLFLHISWKTCKKCCNLANYFSFFSQKKNKKKRLDVNWDDFWKMTCIIENRWEQQLGISFLSLCTSSLKFFSTLQSRLADHVRYSSRQSSLTELLFKYRFKCSRHAFEIVSVDVKFARKLIRPNISLKAMLCDKNHHRSRSMLDMSL